MEEDQKGMKDGMGVMEGGKKDKRRVKGPCKINS